MSYKMIVLDLDDTLLKNDGTISRKTWKNMEGILFPIMEQEL